MMKMDSRYNKTMPQPTFFFYDLETSGFDPRRERIMQFAGQRTSLELEPIGPPVNVLVKLTDEVLPSPQAILITGITPQQTLREGITEAELLHLLTAEVFTPGTITTGFNNVRFDDPFIRFLHYRNFYDPYTWAYADDRSRWDLLDAMRLTRALRPDGFTWPFDESGRPTNTLVALAKANGLEHTHAHDALSDVTALIGLARHLHKSQPKLFDYLLKLRSKHEVAKLVNLSQPQPFVYASGRYLKNTHHTTIAYPIGAGKNNTVIVYDLRHDPAAYAHMTTDQLAAIRWAKADERARPDYRPFPAKELTPGNCPAVAPLATLDTDAEERISLTQNTARRHLEALKTSGLIDKLQATFKPPKFEPLTDADARLYDGFINGPDKAELVRVRTADAAALTTLKPHFNDPRLPELFVRYKARNYPDTLSEAEQVQWEGYRTQRLQTDLPKFAQELERAGQTATPQTAALLTDLKLWAESIAPLG
jgi:exodeoxyribonuclease-1